MDAQLVQALEECISVCKKIEHKCDVNKTLSAQSISGELLTSYEKALNKAQKNITEINSMIVKLQDKAKLVED